MKHQRLETLPEISKRMSKVKLKRGVAESVLAKILWHRGIRYRLNYRALAGSPDIAITKHKVAVFIDGEFWHGQDWENRKARLKRNREYWIEKIEENMARDKRNNATLTTSGWSVIRFWEKEVFKNVNACANTVIAVISTRVGTSHHPENILEMHSVSAIDTTTSAVASSVAQWLSPVSHTRCPIVRTVNSEFYLKFTH